MIKLPKDENIYNSVSICDMNDKLTTNIKSDENRTIIIK